MADKANGDNCSDDALGYGPTDAIAENNETVALNDMKGGVGNRPNGKVGAEAAEDEDAEVEV